MGPLEAVAAVAEGRNKIKFEGEIRMTAKWYPIINYDNCIECGACINKCSHGVYDKVSAKPMVIYPDGCIDHCTGCQALCPAEAIQYFGDTGGPTTTCSCGC